MTDNFSADWIWVTSGKNSRGNRVAIYEANELHPDGQIFVYGDRVRQAYPTDEVVLRMREGFLDEVRNYSPPSEEAPAEEPAAPAEEQEPEVVVATEAQPQFNEGSRETAAQRRARERRDNDGA